MVAETFRSYGSRRGAMPTPRRYCINQNVTEAYVSPGILFYRVWELANWRSRQGVIGRSDLSEAKVAI